VDICIITGYAILFRILKHLLFACLIVRIIMAGSIGEVQVDALPYTDQGYEEPGVRETVRSVTFLSRF